MRRSLLPVVAALLVPGLAWSQEGRPDIYPFDVTVGGQLAKVTDAYPVCARVEKPVAADAAIEVAVAPGTLIINAFPASEKGEVDSSAKGAILMAEGTNRTSLDQTMDKAKLAPGTYLMNVVAGGTTSRVLFTISGDVGSPPSPSP